MSESESKTEKATPKKKRDAARRGETFKARDVSVACVTLCGVLCVVWMGSLADIGKALIGAIHSGFNLDLSRYTVEVLLLGLKIVIPVIIVSFLATAIPSLLLSGFVMAVEAIRFDLAAIHPGRGIKKIFSLRTIKDFVKTNFYLISFIAAAVLTWYMQQDLVFSQVHATIPQIIDIWGRLTISVVLISLGCILLILILDAFLELFLYLKGLRMDKQELKREYMEREGSPLMRSRRRQLRFDFLSAQAQHDIENSRMIIANPTHIAIGIYFKPELSPIPYVSVRESNQRALAVRHYAEKIGVPVIVDVALARRLYRTHKLYSMVDLDEIHAIVDLILWLQKFEFQSEYQL